MIPCSAQTHSVGSLALAGLAALGAATAFSTRRPDLGPAFHLVSPELRAPLLVLGHGPTQAPEPAPSRRRRGSTMTMGRVFPRGLGTPASSCARTGRCAPGSTRPPSAARRGRPGS